jgi:phage terminase small subunit
VIGQENLRKPEIKAAIAEALRQRSERTRVNADKVVRELARIGFLDIRNLVEISGNSIKLKSGVDMTDDDAAAIAEVSDTQFGIKIKTHNKLTALQLLARHTGVIKDNKDYGIESESEGNDLVRALDKTTAEAFADESETETE